MASGRSSGEDRSETSTAGPGSAPSPNEFPVAKALLAAAAFFATKPDAVVKAFAPSLSLDARAFPRPGDFREHIAYIDQFSLRLQELVKLAGHGSPLVVFIDDLDRCLPQHAIHIIEAIKVLLEAPGCIFVLALDREIVESTISVSYKDIISQLPGSLITGTWQSTFPTDYLATLIQLEQSVPRMTHAHIRGFIEGLSSDGEILSCSDILATDTDLNPRRLKRRVRTLAFITNEANHAHRSVPIRSRLVAKLIALNELYREFIVELLEQPTLIEDLEVAYRNPPDGSGRSQTAGTYAARFPLLPKVLTSQLDDGDTFKGVSIRDYLALLGAEGNLPSLQAARAKSIPFVTYVLEASERTILAAPGLGEAVPSFVWPNLQTFSQSAREHEGFGASDGHLSIPQIVQSSRRVIIYGDPGTGKTSLLRVIAGLLAAAMLMEDRGHFTRLLGLVRRTLPIPIQAPDLALFANASGAPTPVVQLFIERVGASYGIAGLGDALNQLAERGDCILLVDALDRVSPDLFVPMSRALNEFLARYPLVRCIATSRIVGQHRVGVAFETFTAFRIGSWSDSDIAGFIRDQLGTEYSRDFVEALFQDSRLLDLARYPLTLRMLIDIWQHARRLPENRLDVFREAASISAERAFTGGPISREEVERAMGIVALGLESEDHSLADVSTIRAWLRDAGSPWAEDPTRVDQLIDTLRNRVGPLAERADGQFGFEHKTFQEFYAARDLAATSEDLAGVVERWQSAPERWRWVLVTLAAILPSRPLTPLLHALLAIRTPESIIQAAQCVSEAPSKSTARLDLETIELLRASLRNVERLASVPEEQRALAVRLLEGLGSS